MDKGQTARGGSAVKKRKLNYRFHNPNSAAETADQLLRVLIEANRGKVEAAMQAAAGLENCYYGQMQQANDEAIRNSEN